MQHLGTLRKAGKAEQERAERSLLLLGWQLNREHEVVVRAADKAKERRQQRSSHTRSASVHNEFIASDSQPRLNRAVRAERAQPPRHSRWRSSPAEQAEEAA